jgi:hypothetical protein
MELVLEVLTFLVEEGFWSACSGATKSQDAAALAAEVRFSSLRSSEEYR